VEKRGQQPDVLNLLAFYSRLQHGETPLSQRGIPHIELPDSLVYCNSLPDKPPTPWQNVFGKPALASLPTGAVQTLQRLQGSGFVAPTPASGRPSVTAAQASRHLHNKDSLSQAGRAWRAVVLGPHKLVRNNNQVFLVVAGGRYAARVWPASACGESYWRLDLTCPWEWLFVDNIEAWHVIDFTWVVDTREAHRYGRVAAKVPGLREPRFSTLRKAQAECERTCDFSFVACRSH
jgi:hypothetical protein